jgi:hypothetical protein
MPAIVNGEKKTKREEVQLECKSGVVHLARPLNVKVEIVIPFFGAKKLNLPKLIFE